MPNEKHGRDKASSKSLAPPISKRMSSKSVSLTLSKEGLVKPGEKKDKLPPIKATNSQDITRRVEERKSKAEKEKAWKVQKKAVHPVGTRDGSKSHSIRVSAPAPTPATGSATPTAPAGDAPADAAGSSGSGSHSSGASAGKAQTPPKDAAAEGEDTEASKRSKQAIRKAVLRAALAQARKAPKAHVSLSVDDSVREQVVEALAKKKSAAALPEPAPQPLPQLVLKDFLQRQMRARIAVTTKPTPLLLSSLEATACIPLLINTADRLDVWKCRLPMIMPYERRTAYKSLAQRFSVYEGTIKSTDDEETKSLKMVEKERIFSEEILRKTATDLLDYNYKSLWSAVLDYDKQLNEEEETMRQRTLLKHLLRQLKLARRREHQRQVAAQIEDSHTAYNMREKLCALHLNQKSQGRYISLWEASRREQHCYLVNKRVEVVQKLVEKRRREVANEKTYYKEMTKLHKLEMTKLEGVMEEWQRKYHQEYEVITNIVMHKQNDLTMLMYQVDSARKELDYRKSQLEDYHAAKLTLLVQTAAALTLQEWWRGVLYRRLVVSAYETLQKARAAYAALQDAVKRQGIAGPKVEKRRQAVKDVKERLKELQLRQKEEHMRLALVQALGALLALLKRTKERTKNWSREDKARARAQALAAAERVAKEHVLRRALALADVKPSSSKVEEEKKETKEEETPQ